MKLKEAMMNPQNIAQDVKKIINSFEQAQGASQVDHGASAQEKEAIVERATVLAVEEEEGRAVRHHELDDVGDDLVEELLDVIVHGRGALLRHVQQHLLALGDAILAGLVAKLAFGHELLE